MTAKLLAVSTCVFICLSAAIAQAETYLCVAEAAGGVAFKNGRWMGMGFRTDEEKYIVTSKDNINYSIRKLGYNFDLLKCERELINNKSANYIMCGNAYVNAFLNFNTKRFQFYYGSGFLDGENSEITPYITVAKCSEIEI